MQAAPWGWGATGGVDFTPLCSRLTPGQLVELLTAVFATMDRLAEKHGLETIKTIGDAYMAVAGLPLPRPDHAEAMAEFALDVRAAVSRLGVGHGQHLELRIGINTGPVVAGVISTRRFIYDLWGNAVNLASRMESQGVVGGIQVTEATHVRLCENYRFESRGGLPIKGKGKMPVYLLGERLESASLRCEKGVIGPAAASSGPIESVEGARHVWS